MKRSLKGLALVFGLVLFGSLCQGCRFVDPGDLDLQAYVKGGGNVLKLVGTNEGVFFVHRGSFFLTDSKWQWEGADEFQFTNDPASANGRRVRVRIKEPAEFGLSATGHVREYDKHSNKVIDPRTGAHLEAPFVIEWSPK